MRASLILTFIILLPFKAYAGVFSKASVLSGVPVSIIKSVAYVESGLKPYALDIDGRAYFAKNYDDAYYIARYFINKGYSVDVGLMQVNYNIWAKRLGMNLRSLLIPKNNVMAGAYILGRYIIEKGNLVKGIGRYHSGDHEQAEIYEKKVIWAYNFFSR